MPKPYNVFLSCSRTDSAVMRRVTDDLRKDYANGLYDLQEALAAPQALPKGFKGR